MSLNIKSVWEGWIRKCLGRRISGPGEYCALGYVENRLGFVMKEEDQERLYERVTTYIKANYSPVVDPYNTRNLKRAKSWDNFSNNRMIIACASNMFLEPADFVRIDKCTQLQELRLSAEQMKD